MAQSKSFFDDVKKELECPVCQEHFSQINEPKILKCLHTFCKTCLEGWIRQHREGQLSCPTCRQITECPNSNINSLPSNLFYKQMVEIVEAYSGQGEEDSPHCGLCGEKKSLKFYCFECNSFLCNGCVGVHKKGKIFSGHHVKDIGNFESSDMNDYARRSNYCKTHIKEIRFYCERCQSCICIECAILEHKDHNMISLDQGLDNFKSEIGIKVHEVQETRSRLRNYKVSLEKRKRKVDTNIEEATKEVKRVAEQCILLIRQHEVSVTEQLTARKEAFKGAFDGQMSKLDGKMMEIDSTLAFSEEILLRNNLPEILNVKSVLERRLQELSLPSQFFEGVLKLGCSGVKYVQSDVTLLRNIPGKLVTSNTEPSLTVAEGQNLTKGVLGADCTFTVTTKNAADETTYCEIDEVHVKITSLTGREKIRTVVTDLKDGCYSVSYIPTTPGKFTVAIEVAGNPIMGSPFKLTVIKERKLYESFKSPSARKMKQVDHQQWKYGESGARKQKVIDNEEISNLTPAHLRKLHTLELRYSVQLTVEKELERIVIDGQYEDVLQVFVEILDLLHEAEKDKHERNHAEMLSKDIQWQYEEDGTFEDYDGNLNDQIELAFQKNKSKIDIQMGEENYTVKFDTMTMEDEGGIATDVKRIDLPKDVEFPPYWTPQPTDSSGREETVHLVQLDSVVNAEEYKKVSDQFHKTCPNNIFKIERVQNPALYGAYKVYKQAMDKAGGRGSNEMNLFHGTKGQKCQIINHKGFNRSFCGENASLYGNGVYFALQASYAARSTYSPRDPYGFRYMYLAKVLVGDYTVGRQGMLVPPVRNANDFNDHYDTVVDNVTNPGIFVVFYDWQCYPEYLITFQ